MNRQEIDKNQDNNLIIGLQNVLLKVRETKQYIWAAAEKPYLNKATYTLQDSGVTTAMNVF